MSKLVLAVLDDKDQLQKFEEIDMSWVTQFNEEFKKNDVPFQKAIYEEELVDMTSYSVLNSFVLTENDETFRVNREPLKTILRKLFDYNEPTPPATQA